MTLSVIAGPHEILEDLAVMVQQTIKELVCTSDALKLASGQSYTTLAAIWSLHLWFSDGSLLYA